MSHPRLLLAEDHAETAELLRLQQTAEQFRGFRVVFGKEQAWVRHVQERPECMGAPRCGKWRATEARLEKLPTGRGKNYEEQVLREELLSE